MSKLICTKYETKIDFIMHTIVSNVDTVDVERSRVPDAWWQLLRSVVAEIQACNSVHVSAQQEEALDLVVLIEVRPKETEKLVCIYSSKMFLKISGILSQADLLTGRIQRQRGRLWHCRLGRSSW